MVFPSIARRLRSKRPQLFQSQQLLPTISNSPSPPPDSSHLLRHHISQAFHRTPAVPFETPHHFSTLRPFSAQNLTDPWGFNGQRFKFSSPDALGNSGRTQFLELLKRAGGFASEAEAMAFLDESGVEVSRETVLWAIWELRGYSKLAFLAFKFGEKWSCCDEEACSLMVWVLGSHKKFSTAWCLVRDLHRTLMDTRRAMLIMIDRYAYANDPCKAIKTFQIMDKFRLTPEQEAFHILLTALCKYGNIEEAEEFMLVNKKLFPLETQGFNIILNGWCNISDDAFEAKRVWREMAKCCITPDATSYTHLISCFSKEALKILESLKEMGLKPDSTTYNSMICPLCESRKLEEARQMLAAMMEDNLSPTIETYHSFLQSTGLEGTLEILQRMKKANLGPRGSTFHIILGKFFRVDQRQPEMALKIWAEMKHHGVVPDSTHYTVMVQGLATCGLLMKAREFFAEMRSNGFVEDPKLKNLLKEPVRGSSGFKGKQGLRPVKQTIRVNQKQGRVSQSRKKNTSVE